jgi:hypothetical protein
MGEGAGVVTVTRTVDCDGTVVRDVPVFWITVTVVRGTVGVVLVARGMVAVVKPVVRVTPEEPEPEEG